MSGHEFQSYFPDSGSIDYSDTSTAIDEAALAELRELAGRYPQPRSALLPMLHLVQSYDGRVSPAGVKACAEILGITEAQVSGVATFYTMYRRRPGGDHHIGVCTTSLCAVMGGDILLDRVSKRLGIHEGEVTPDGAFS
ncbi:MAG TPA: NADH-quinone oxidoreductase subunit E, partial [Propionibacteriaceae bacterium]|nr:NADH-quinone oxidoreductase subunit E [Propionibacteriaceae bacterium]